MIIGSGALLLIALLALAFWASVRVVLKTGAESLVKPLRLGLRFSFVAVAALKGFQAVVKLIPGSPVDAQVQTGSPFWPTLPAEIDYRSNAMAHVLSGGFRYADVTVTGLSFAARAVLATADLSFGVLMLASIWSLDRMLSAASQGFSIRTVSVKALRRTGWLVLWLGELGSFLYSWGSTLVARDLAPSTADFKAPSTLPNPFAHGFDGSQTEVVGLVHPSTYLNFDVVLWPLLGCIVLLVLATLIGKGREVQAATDGLV